MPRIRGWLKQNLPPNTVDTLRSVRHVSAQAIAGADLWYLRRDLEHRIEQRLHETDAAQDVRIMAAVSEEIRTELDRWSEEMLDRMDVLLGASNRLVAACEERIADLERRLASMSAGANGHAPSLEIAASPSTVGS